MRSPSQGLCVACGLCCDGTLYAWAPLAEGDDAASLQAAGFDERHGDQGHGDEGRHFALPCQHLCERACGIYHRWRPRICGSYRCRLLRRHDDGELSYAEALDTIGRTTAHVDRVRAALRTAGGTARGALGKLYAAWERSQADSGSSAWARRNSTFLLDFAGLQRRLDRYFREELGRQDWEGG